MQDEIVSAHKVEIKPLFEKRYKKILGERYDEFMDYSFRYIRKCIRVNTLKIGVDELRERLEKQGWELLAVPWCKEGFFIEGYKHDNRYDVGNLIEHTLGYFYVQEAASMIPPVVLFNGLQSRDGQTEIDFSELKVLDLCAAPGSKTSQIAQYMGDEGLLIANDVDATRLKPLSLNLQRMGASNTLLTLHAFQEHKRSPKPKNPFGKPFFDMVLVDAPCSGTGTIRKSFKVMEMYSDNLVRKMAATQKMLIKLGYSMLKPDGIMVYSTCTLEPAEDEAVVSHLMDEFSDVEVLPINLDIKKSAPVLSFDGETFNPAVKNCLRIYPQDNDSEGFFVAKIRKKSIKKIIF